MVVARISSSSSLLPLLYTLSTIYTIQGWWSCTTVTTHGLFSAVEAFEKKDFLPQQQQQQWLGGGASSSSQYTGVPPKPSVVRNKQSEFDSFKEEEVSSSSHVKPKQQQQQQQLDDDSAATLANNKCSMTQQQEYGVYGNVNTDNNNNNNNAPSVEIEYKYTVEIDSDDDDFNEEKVILFLKKLIFETLLPVLIEDCRRDRSSSDDDHGGGGDGDGRSLTLTGSSIRDESRLSRSRSRRNVMISNIIGFVVQNGEVTHEPCKTERSNKVNTCTTVNGIIQLFTDDDDDDDDGHENYKQHYNDKQFESLQDTKKRVYAAMKSAMEENNIFLTSSTSHFTILDFSLSLLKGSNKFDNTNNNYALGAAAIEEKGSKVGGEGFQLRKMIPLMVGGVMFIIGLISRPFLKSDEKNEEEEDDDDDNTNTSDIEKEFVTNPSQRTPTTFRPFFKNDEKNEKNKNDTNTSDIEKEFDINPSQKRRRSTLGSIKEEEFEENKV